MKILYHHRTLADGAEAIHIDAMVQAFTDLGHIVRVLGVRPQQHAKRRGLAQALRDVLPSAAVELVASALNVPEYIHVRRQIRQFSPDLVYKRHARFDIAAIAAARNAGIPSVLEVNSLFTQGAYHDFEPLTFHRLGVTLERRALQMATVIGVVSTPLAHQVETLVSRRADVVPNGASPEAFDPASANPDRVRARHHVGRHLTIGWAGILREWHGLRILLEAVAEIPGVTLFVVGDGPARAAIEGRSASLHIRERLIITGRIPHAEMPDYIAAMDIAVVPDERTGVASPMKLPEYMAMGRAVVAPDLANLRDLITDGVDGLLFEAGDAKDLRRVLCRLTDDTALRDRLGQNARSKVLSERNWRRNAETVLRLSSLQVPSVPADAGGSLKGS